MAPRTSSELTDLIKNLRTIRRHHEKALADIQITFRSAGMEHLLESTRAGKRGAAAAPAAGKVGRGKAKAAGTKTRGKGKAGKAGKAAKAPKATTGTRRKRAKYSQTAEEFILSFLGKHRSATTSEIRQHWQKQGRGGKAENSLTGLVKSGKLIRTARPGQAGSSYSLPGSGTST